MRHEKRDSERVPILGQLHGEIMVFEPMSVKELSRGGVSVETRTALQLDSLHQLRLTLDTSSVIVQARVVHAHISDVDQDAVTYRSGLEFIELSARVESAILRFLKALKASRGVDA